SAAAWPNGFRQARFLSAVDHVQLDRLRRLVMQVMDGCFAQVDAIIGPSLAGPMMIITNFTGHPCLCLPAGFISSPSRQQASLSRPVAASAEGPHFTVPHNICLWGKLFDEGTILAIGRALEEKLGLGGRRPAVD
ncbi:MAG TPA: amidase, partial [Acetobacteraceae bacterium]|nr:amidase [Acetobacteraceae bacterium]